MVFVIGIHSMENIHILVKYWKNRKKTSISQLPFIWWEVHRAIPNLEFSLQGKEIQRLKLAFRVLFCSLCQHRIWMLADGLSHRPSHGLGILKTHPYTFLEDGRLPSNVVCSRTRDHMVTTIARCLVSGAKMQTVERDASACSWGLHLAKNHCLP